MTISEESTTDATICQRHGGPWGGDETCENCTTEDGDTRPIPDEPYPAHQRDAGISPMWQTAIEKADNADHVEVRVIIRDARGRRAFENDTVLSPQHAVAVLRALGTNAD